MTLSVRVVLHADDGTATVVCEVCHLDREPLTLDRLGLGLGEAKDLLGAVQSALVTEQVNAGVAAQVACPHCGRPRRHKDNPPSASARTSVAGSVLIDRASLAWEPTTRIVCYHTGLVWTSPLGRTYHTQPPPITHELPQPQPRPDDPRPWPFARSHDDRPILDRPPSPPDPPPAPSDPDQPPPF
jgi:hypothetical protein